jgi:carboxymethylenebutenolidase
MNRSTGEAGQSRPGQVLFWGALCSGALAAVMLRPPSSAFAGSRTADIHAEYVKYLSGNDTITAYLAYPERRDAAPGVIVIHEIFGLSDFVRQTTERLASDGFVAIAPDLLSRNGGTAAAGENVRSLISSLPKNEVAQDLDATFAYLKTLKSVRGDRIGTIGFCWGGGQSFQYAAHNPDLKAFVVCYGPSPSPAEVARIRAKGLGVYAENDARINANLPALDTAVRQAGNDYAYAIYPGTGHGFIRSRDNPAAADSAWRAIVGFFRSTLER